MPATRFAPPGPLGYGGAPLGNMFARIDEATARGALDAAWEGGIRYFDTAPHYGSGLSEHRFGEALRDRPREELVLSTKVGRLLRADASRPENKPFVHGLPFRVQLDYSADATLRSVEDSLQRLGMDRIDIAFIHDLAEDHLGAGWTGVFDQAMQGAARALVRLREEGVIKAWGLGVNRVEACARALEMSDPDVFLLAGRYSLLDHDVALDTLFPGCAARGVHVVVGGPYNSGLLAGGAHYEYAEAPAEKIAARDRMAAVAGRHGVDLRAAALQFCTAHPVVAATIPGAKSAGRVRQNLELSRAAIPAGFWAELKAERLLRQDAPVPG